MPTIAAADLPAPRLELRWEPIPIEEQEQGYISRCIYSFVFPLNKYDIRAEHDGPDGHEFGRWRTWSVQVGSTRSTGTIDLKYHVEQDCIDTPFRDGAHIRWDCPYFGNPPMFAVCGDRAMALEPLPETTLKERQL